MTETSGTYEYWVGYGSSSLFRPLDQTPVDINPRDLSKKLVWRFWADSFETAKHITWLFFPVGKNVPLAGSLWANYNEAVALTNFIGPEHPEYTRLKTLVDTTIWKGQNIQLKTTAKKLGIVFATTD